MIKKRSRGLLTRMLPLTPNARRDEQDNDNKDEKEEREERARRQEEFRQKNMQPKYLDVTQMTREEQHRAIQMGICQIVFTWLNQYWMSDFDENKLLLLELKKFRKDIPVYCRDQTQVNKLMPLVEHNSAVVMPVCVLFVFIV